MLHRYQSRQALAEALGAGVAAVLAGGIATRGAATLAVSGGSTPQLFLQTLARAAIAWNSVTVTLVDERWVPESHARSNAALVRRHLLRDHAAAARFEPLFEAGAESPDAALDGLAARLGGLARPFDAVVLGMGTDGHTASFFPGAANLAAVLDPHAAAPVAVVRAPGAGEPRVTLTLSRLVDARLLALHIEGEEKLAVLQAAEGDGPASALPVRAVLRHPRPHPLAIFWAPLSSHEA